MSPTRGGERRKQKVSSVQEVTEEEKGRFANLDVAQPGQLQS